MYWISGPKSAIQLFVYLLIGISMCSYTLCTNLVYTQVCTMEITAMARVYVFTLGISKLFLYRSLWLARWGENSTANRKQHPMQNEFSFSDEVWHISHFAFKLFSRSKEITKKCMVGVKLCMVNSPPHEKKISAVVMVVFKLCSILQIDGQMSVWMDFGLVRLDCFHSSCIQLLPCCVNLWWCWWFQNAAILIFKHG